MNKNNIILEVNNVQKFYGKFPAVKDMTFRINKGEIFALLGHNGAGKSTLIKMILGLVKPSLGKIKIEGLTYDDKNRKIKEKIGYLPERMNFYDNLTAWETITFYAKLKNITFDRCEEVLKQVGLGEAKHRRVGAFSKGMQQRLGLAQAIIHKPDLLVLDEPTTGLDPLGIIELKKMIRQWNKEGTTVFFSSHNLNDVEELAQNIGIMHQGELVLEGSLQELQERLNLQAKIEIELSSIPIDLEQRLKKINIKEYLIKQNKIIIYSASNKKMQLLKSILQAGLNVQDFFLEEPGLNLIYQSLMNKINKKELKENPDETSHCQDSVVLEC